MKSVITRLKDVQLLRINATMDDTVPSRVVSRVWLQVQVTVWDRVGPAQFTIYDRLTR